MNKLNRIISLKYHGEVIITYTWRRKYEVEGIKNRWRKLYGKRFNLCTVEVKGLPDNEIKKL